MNVVPALFSLILLNSAYRNTTSIFLLKSIKQNGKVNEISSIIQKWLNHEWMQTWDVDVEPVNEKTFPYCVPVSEFFIN